ncbi:RIP metalloprotease RseP [bacterium]|nr:RIP metalloprotease RseP [bacterium]
MNIILMLLLISLLIIVHELGHFIAAKLMGVKVSKFAIGLPFGPTLYKRKFGETTFLIHSFLLGGYVSFPDDNCPENKEELNDEDAEVLPEDSPLRFKNKNGWQQAFILVAGVACNVIFAFMLVLFCAFYWQKIPTNTYEVFVAGTNKPQDTSNILEKGIQKGDRLYKINGIEIDNPQEFFFVLQNAKPYDGKVSKEKQGEVLKNILALNKKYDANSIAKQGSVIYLPKRTYEEKLITDKNTALGLKKLDDKEIKLNAKEMSLRDKMQSQKITLAEDTPIVEIANAWADYYKPFDIVILRDGKTIEYKNVIPDKSGLLGLKISYTQNYTQTKDIKTALRATNTYITENTRLMVVGLWQLVTGNVPLNQMHGIVAITKIGGDIIQHKGLMEGLLLTAIISIDLALINILPIPALDGGHLMFLAIEKITRRKIDEKAYEILNSIFFYALMLLMIFIVGNDIFAIITKQF